jgi:hypothetical protein
LSGYVTIHVTNIRSQKYLRLYPFDSNGGRDRTRTCDLLRVKNSGSFYTFYLLLWLSTTWGVCFRSADIS